MDRIIAKPLLAGLLALFASVAAAQGGPAAVSPEVDPDIVISTGAVGGGYWSAGDRLQVVAEEMGLAVENIPSKGSLENLDRLRQMSSPVNMAFAQADALQHYLGKNPAQEKKIEILENIGQECVFILTGSKSGIRTDEDLQKAKNLRLGIASATSGIAVTFDYMSSLVPELRDIEVNYADTSAAMDQLQKPGGTVDAIMVVHLPRERSPEVDAALENPDHYRFVKLADERLTAELENGRRVYRAMKLAMPGRAQPVNTICVRGLLLLNKLKLTGTTRNKLTDLVNYYWMRVYATP